MTTVEATRRDLRRTLPEFAAVIAEFRDAWVSPFRRQEIPPTYGEQILTLASPLLTSYAEAARRPEYLDTMPDEEVLALWAVVSPVVELRRSRRAEFERRHPGAR